MCIFLCCLVCQYQWSIGCEDRLRNHLDCVGCSVKLFSNLTLTWGSSWTLSVSYMFVWHKSTSCSMQQLVVVFVEHRVFYVLRTTERHGTQCLKLKPLCYWDNLMPVVEWTPHGSCSVQDFSTGKTYEQKVVLMNNTHTITYCKLVGMSEELKDFISLSYVWLCFLLSTQNVLCH